MAESGLYERVRTWQSCAKLAWGEGVVVFWLPPRIKIEKKTNLILTLKLLFDIE